MPHPSFFPIPHHPFFLLSPQTSQSLLAPGISQSNSVVNIFLFDGYTEALEATLGGSSILHVESMCSVHLSCCDKISQHWDRFGRTQLAPLHWPTSRIVPSRLWMMELQTRSNNKAKGCFETWLQLNHQWQKQIAKRYQKALIKPRILLPRTHQPNLERLENYGHEDHPGYGAKTDQPETITQSHA